MKLRHYRHSCIKVSLAARRVLIDPGSFSPAARDQTDIIAVVITHGHADHLDLEALDHLLLVNPSLTVFADPETARRHSRAGRRIEPLSPGQYVQLEEGISIEGVGGEHAIIHPDIPRVANVGFILTAPGEPRLGVTGDSLQDIGDFHGIDALVAPLAAPWSKISETIDFLRLVHPKRYVPVHDAILSIPGREIFARQVAANLPPTTEFVDWPHTQTINLPLPVTAL